MSLMTSYLVKISNLADFFNAIRSAKAPERFSSKFLKDLEFTSSNDRLFLGVLKGLGFVDENGAPKQRYFDFLDQSISGRVLAEAIEEAYGDLFNLRRDAHKMEVADVKGKFRSLTQGQKSDNVINNMAATFKALCEQADWTHPKKKTGKKAKEKIPHEPGKEIPDGWSHIDPAVDREEISNSDKLQLHYNIQIILPNSRDPAVFDALFSSLKRHLL